MNIVQVSTSDLGHGAGIVAYNLHRSFKQHNHQSSMLVVEKRAADPDVFTLSQPNKNLWQKIGYRIAKKRESKGNRSGPQNIYSRFTQKLLNHPLVAAADVINLHNLHWHENNLSPLILPRLAQQKPVIWTLHDMWAFTGHCIYSMGCDRWKTGCGQCPDLSTYIALEKDTTAQLYQCKQAIYSKARFTLVTPSTWLEQLASQSPLFQNQPITYIPHGIDLKLYSPRPKRAAKESLGLDPDRPVILFAAALWEDFRKGYGDFATAVLHAGAQGWQPQLLGIGLGEFSSQLARQFPTLSLGFVTQEHLKAIVYSASDLLIFPTLADNLPNTILESMACGTPVLSYNTGGVADMVKHLETGYPF